MSEKTNYLAIDVKNDREKSLELPALRKTPQMLASGWGGTGSVMSSSEIYKKPTYFRTSFGNKQFSGFAEAQSDFITTTIGEIKSRNIRFFLGNFNNLHSKIVEPALRISILQDLRSMGLKEDILNDLTIAIHESGVDKWIIAVIFLYQLCQLKELKKDISRSLRRIITKSFKLLPSVSDDIYQKIEKISLSVTVQ